MIPHNLSKNLAELVLRQGELRLSSQLQIALAADLRAVTVSAILIAIGAALLGFAGEQINANSSDIHLAVAALVASIGVFLATAFCISAAWPTKFDLVGAQPNNWWNDNVIDKSIENCLYTESINYDRRIRDNRHVLRRNARRFRAGMYMACGAPILGLFAWVVSRLFL